MVLMINKLNYTGNCLIFPLVEIFINLNSAQLQTSSNNQSFEIGLEISKYS